MYKRIKKRFDTFLERLFYFRTERPHFLLLASMILFGLPLSSAATMLDYTPSDFSFFVGIATLSLSAGIFIFTLYEISGFQDVEKQQEDSNLKVRVEAMVWSLSSELIVGGVLVFLGQGLIFSDQVYSNPVSPYWYLPEISWFINLIGRLSVGIGIMFIVTGLLQLAIMVRRTADDRRKKLKMK